MGIKDLSSWVKAKHPSVIKTFPKRWASPEIRGTRVAIDATLLTNRFHFAMTDGELKGKGSLIGWYNLINVMRMHDIKPIAVWDRPGTRAWKFGENKRRWVTRGLNYARRTHEEKREERLAGLIEAFDDLERMGAEEQGAVRDHLARTGVLEGLIKEEGKGGATAKAAEAAVVGTDSKFPTSPAPSPISDRQTPPYAASPPASASPTSVPTEDATPDELASLERIANMVDTVSEHIALYRQSLATPEISLFPTQVVLEEALERVKELEDLYESLDEGDLRMKPAPKSGVATAVAATSEPQDAGPLASSEEAAVIQSGEEEEPLHEALKLERERERDQEWLVEKMSEIMPPSLFSESRKQAAMSIEEGRILEAYLRPSDSSPPAEFATMDAASVAGVPDIPPATVPAAPSKAASDPLLVIDPLRRLSDLLTQVPETKAIYDRALGQPNKYTYLDCQDLLHRMGVPVIMADAPYEAEGLATALIKAGLADWVATEDSDVIPLGLRNISTIKQPLSTIDTPSLLSALSLTPRDFIDFCILLGNDAVPRIPGVGPVKALKLIKETGSIEAALQGSPRIREAIAVDMPAVGVPGVEAYMDMVNTARAVFGDLPVITDEMKDEIERAGVLQQAGEAEGEAHVGAGVGDGRAERESERMRDVERWLEDKHGIAFVDADAARFQEIDSKAYDEP